MRKVPFESAHFNMSLMTWFANRGQIIQISLAASCLGLAAIVAWPTLKGNQFFSPGAILFYLLIGLVVFSTYRTIHLPKSSSEATAISTIPQLAITPTTRFHEKITIL